TYYVPPTPPNPRPNQRTPNSHILEAYEYLCSRILFKSDNSNYGILLDDEEYIERGDHWTPISEASLRRRIENDDWSDMNPGQAQEMLDQM
ncbi:3068_t:CDS:2, partial [Racocetra fulgida]